MINVRWDDLEGYIAWLNTVTKKGPKERFRLPSEAEWEYAARAGTKTPYWWGDDVQQDGKVWANCDGCGSDWDDDKTAPVGQFPANPFGLYDTAGNVYEWVEDCWHENYEDAPDDGSAWLETNDGNCARRVIRGGSWYGVPGNLRSANRGRYRDDRPTHWFSSSPGPSGLAFSLCSFTLCSKALTGGRMMVDNTPKAVSACHELLKWLIPQLDKFPRLRRFTLGERLEQALLEVLELLVEAAYTRHKQPAAPGEPAAGGRSPPVAAGPRAGGRPYPAL